MPENQRIGPLSGVRIVDLSRGVAGGYCTRLLAGFGADVIKIEQPGAGDLLRREGPFADPGNTAESGALHLYLNAGKRSITLDTSTPTGRDILDGLLKHADALVDDRAPGVLESEGFDTSAFALTFPTLVVTHLSAYGQAGPYSSVPATNLTSLAMGGQMSPTGDPDREPLKNGGYQADYQLGLNGMTATLAGLWAAGRDGAGDEIDVAAMECMASTLELSLNQYCYTQMDLGSGRRGNVMSSAIGLYPCEDGFIGIHAMPRNFPALARLIDAEWMLESEEFGTSAARMQHDDELRAMIYAWASGQSKKAAYEKAGTMRAPLAYVHEIPDLLASPQLQARHAMEEIEHPVAGKHVYPGAPWQMKDTPWQGLRAPLLGEHTDAVLADLGLTAQDMAVLRAQGVI